MEGGSLLMLQCSTIGSVFVASVGAAGVCAGEVGCDELVQPARTPPTNRVRQFASDMFRIFLSLFKGNLKVFLIDKNIREQVHFS
jgi:hypothetical protein